MKKSIILCLILILTGYLCDAQTDTTLRPSDSLAIKAIDTSQMQRSSAELSDTSKYALLYVYRPKKFAGSAIVYTIRISNSLLKDEVVGDANNNTKFMIKLYEEGKTEISAKTESKRSVTLNVRFGEKYYLKCGVTMGVLVGRPELLLIDPLKGEIEYANVKGK